MRSNDLIVIVVIGAFVVLTLSWLTLGGGMGSHMMWPGIGVGYGYVNPLFIVIFLGIVGVGAYLLLSGVTSQQESKEHRALDIARERYARGEITAEAFEEIKRNLT